MIINLRTKIRRFVICINTLLSVVVCVAQTIHFSEPICIDDTIHKTRLPFIDAGAAGKEILWDFRSLTLSDGIDYPVIYHYSVCDSQYIFSTTEHNTRYYWRYANDSLFCTGYENYTTYMPYSQPALRQTRYMFFGDSIHSAFDGKGEYSHLLPLSVSGKTRTIFDAEGTLILQNETIPDVKRMHTMQQYNEVFADTTHLQMHLWQWYKDAYPMPIFETMQTMIADSVIFSMSLLCSPSEQQKHFNITDSIENNHKPGDITSILTTISFIPNPVETDLTIYYSLLQEAMVSFVLNSPLGVNIFTQPPISQSEGQHTQIIPMAGLQTGTYTLYIIVNNMQNQEVIIKR